MAELAHHIDKPVHFVIKPHKSEESTANSQDDRDDPFDPSSPGLPKDGPGDCQSEKGPGSTQRHGPQTEANLPQAGSGGKKKSRHDTQTCTQQSTDTGKYMEHFVVLGFPLSSTDGILVGGWSQKIEKLWPYQKR